MKHLTNREEEIMEIFWKKDSMFVKDVIKLLADPNLHYNTVSTMVRGVGREGVFRSRTVWKYIPLLSRHLT